MMDIIDLLGSHADQFQTLQHELRSGLELFWTHAGTVLRNSGVQLAPATDRYYALRHNFFSALFLLSFQRADIAPNQRIRLVAVNQCLRGMVTGCDNILDNEYKMTLDTDIPSTGTRFRSVMDIMVSDRVLFDLLLDMHEQEQLPISLVRRAHAASLQALARSGVQEASEEEGVREILAPERILSEIHHLKTGVLFQCVWAIPLVLTPELESVARPLADALYDIGMGCQILDDMVDLRLDAGMQRHNYLMALLAHRTSDPTRMQQLISTSSDTQSILELHPQVRHEATSQALEFLRRGLTILFGPSGNQFVGPAMHFFIHRIGAQELVSPELRP